MKTDQALTAMSEPSTTDEGKGVEFRLTTANGKSLDLWMPSHELQNFINDLIFLAQSAARVRTNDVPLPFEGARPTILSKAEATNLGVAEGSDKLMYLLVRLHDVDMSFRVDTKELIGWGESLVLAGKALQADKKIAH
jgi:hypothetical protein